MSNASTKEAEATVLGLVWDDGVLKQKKMNKEGKVYLEDIPHAPLATEKIMAKKAAFEAQTFTKTEKIPDDLTTVNTSPLISKAVAKEIEQMEKAPDVIQEMLTHYIEKILALNALLLRVVGSPETLAQRTEPLRIKDSGFCEYIHLQMDVLGGPWLAVKNKVKN